MRLTKTVGLVCLLTLALASGALYFWVSQRQPLPALKCKTTAKVKIEAELGELIFSINESLQLYDSDKGLIQYEGYVKSAHDNTYLERTVYLNKGIRVDRFTWYFTIEKIAVSPLDTTPDEIFNRMWLENTGDNVSMVIGIQPVREKAYVISSPYSPLFICVAW